MYVDLVMLLNFLVDFFLLVAVNRLSGYPPDYKRVMLSAVLGGIYGGACLIPGLMFMSGIVYRILVLVLMILIAYGYRCGAWRRGILFVLLSMALCGLVVGLEQGGSLKVIACAAFVGILAYFSCRSAGMGQRFVSVQLRYQGKSIKLTALRDTGNGLRDPLTGQSVLVVGADTALKLTGLTKEQLRQPAENLLAHPGLRLIPYRAVGCNSGLLLALRIPTVKIGHWQGSSLVAFSPDGLEDEDYQALTGGVA